jgi:hypothetical protein
MHPVSLLLLLVGALSALAGVPFVLTGNSLAGPQPTVQTPSLAPQTCQADEVAGKQWNMTWLPAFFSSLVLPSPTADTSSPYLGVDQTIAIYTSKTTGLRRADAAYTRTGTTNETMLSTVPATSTQRIETGAAGLGVIALAVVLWL